MLDSVKITRRQSEIRQQLAELAAKPDPSEDETRSMEAMDREYRTNETRYRAALIAEDEERREAGEEVETREGREWADMASRFEVRQAVLFHNEGRALTGVTAEVAEELRSKGGFQGVPVPLEALAPLETRAGETTSTGVPSPRVTAPILDRLFPNSVAAAMGARMIQIGVGEREYPVATSGAVPGWQGSETGDVPGPQAFTTEERVLKPEHTLGVQMQITRKALLQSGQGLEQAIRRDAQAAIAVEKDRAVFLGSGSGGEPLGVVAGASTYGIAETAVDGEASYTAFRDAAVRFMGRNAAGGIGAVRSLIRDEVFAKLDDRFLAGTDKSEWDRLQGRLGAVTMTHNALEAPAGSPAASKVLLTTTVGGVEPIFVGMWGAVDLIRDPYTKAKSGQLLLTWLLTMDVTISRPEQLEVLTGVE